MAPSLKLKPETASYLPSNNEFPCDPVNTLIYSFVSNLENVFPSPGE
jgi:hypothetical protein